MIHKVLCILNVCKTDGTCKKCAVSTEDCVLPDIAPENSTSCVFSQASLNECVIWGVQNKGQCQWKWIKQLLESDLSSLKSILEKVTV